jgi:tetratricopeptide (TPR) repeat protein
MSTRIETIRAMLTDNPGDVFLLYSLGMEEASAGRLDLAAEALGECITADGDYLPARIELAKVLRSAGELDQARESFEGALELADRQGDTHSADSIRGQLEALGR